MPLAKEDVQKAAELWRIALKTENGIAVQTSSDRHRVHNLLQEARARLVGTEEAYEYKVLIPEEPEDEVWIVRRLEGETNKPSLSEPE